MGQVKLKKIKGKANYYYTSLGKALRLSTGISINDSDITGKGEIKQSFLTKNPPIVAKLQYINQLVDNYVIKNKVNPSIDYIKEQINKDITAHKKDNTDLLSYYSAFYNHKKDKIETEKRSYHTLKAYKSSWNSLIDYQTYRDKTLTINDITNDFVDDYSKVLTIKRKNTTKKKYYSKGLAPNSAQKRLDDLFTFFRYLVDEKIIKSIPKTKQLKINRPIKVVLNNDEVLDFYAHNSPDIKLNRIKDIFIFCCYTGFRFGDLTTLKKIDFFKKKNGSYFVRKMSNKTGVYVSIPLNDIALEIATKLKFNFKTEINVIFNKKLKQIAKESNLFNYKELKNDIEYDKYELITCHTGRHSFITNLIKASVSINYIMGMTGHQKLETLNKYIQDREPEDNTIVNKAFLYK